MRIANVNLKAYTDVMKKALVEEKSPLDACLESVLPGVHQWHHANNAAIASLRDDMKTMNVDIKDGLSQIVGELHQTRKRRSDQDIQLAGVLEIGRQVLLTGKPIAECNAGNLFTPQHNTTTNNNVQYTPSSPLPTPTDLTNQICGDDRAELEKHKTYMMKPKHNSLSELLSEWVGAGDFNDGYGGIEGRNNKFGASWRKHLTSYIYSRTERTVKGIRAFAEQRNISDFDACRELQEVYEQQRWSVSNMVNYFNSSGLLTKRKPRGKKVNGTSRNVSPSPAN